MLNYLAYSWLEREYKIDEAMRMLEKAYALRSNDPYITDSIGWAYYLIENYIEAEKYLKKAVTYNGFITILRQISNKNEIVYTSKIKYTNSVHYLEYYFCVDTI